jgi:hypothetical protein
VSERRLRFQWIDQLGRLVRVWESPAQAAKRGLGEVSGEYGGYVEVYPPDEAREILQRDLEDVERRLDG